MQYCSLQHWTLLSPPDISRTEHRFCFGPATSFFLELFLHSSLVAYWTPSDPGGLILRCHIFLPFHIVHGILMERILEWLAISFSDGPHFVRTFHSDCSVCKSLHHMAHSFINLCKPLHNNKAIIHKGDFWLYLFISNSNFMQLLLNSFPAFSI